MILVPSYMIALFFSCDRSRVQWENKIGDSFYYTTKPVDFKGIEDFRGVLKLFLGAYVARTFSVVSNRPLSPPPPYAYLFI